MASSEYYVADNSNMEEKMLEAAKSHYSSGHYEAALKLYLGMLNSSISYKLYHRIGKCYYKMNEIDKAEEYFEKSIKLEKFANPSYIYLGNICYKSENISKAIYYWMCAYAYKPNDETICLNLATSYFSKGMKFQSVFYYEKYLECANNKKSDAYKAIKESLDKYNQIGTEFLQKARLAYSRRDNKSAIEFLNFAVKNQPVNFDINYMLGSLYLEENDCMKALIYLRQAYCLDSKSLDTIQKLASAYISVGDYTGAYCTMRRLLPLVIHNQAEYLKTMKVIKELDASFDELSYKGHKEYGDEYYKENNYHFALQEYENCMILNEKVREELDDKVNRIRSFINPKAGYTPIFSAKDAAAQKASVYNV